MNDNKRAVIYYHTELDYFQIRIYDNKKRIDTWEIGGISYETLMNDVASYRNISPLKINFKGWGWNKKPISLGIDLLTRIEATKYEMMTNLLKHGYLVSNWGLKELVGNDKGE